MHKLGSNVRKSKKQHFQPQIKKVDGDVVMLSNNTIEQNSGETSTLNFISLLADQTLDGWLVITIKSEALVEEDGG
jgi:hypothetical protein